MGKLVVFHLTEGMTDTSYRKNRPHPGDRKHLFDKRKGIRAFYVFRGGNSMPEIPGFFSKEINAGKHLTFSNGKGMIIIVADRTSAKRICAFSSAG